MNKRYDKISTYFKENLLLVVILCITALCFDGLMCLIPQLEGKTINSLYINDFNSVMKNVIYFISVVLFVQINRFFKRLLVRKFGKKIKFRMREVSYNNLLNKKMNYFLNNTSGDILTKNMTDINDITEGIRKITTEVFDTIVLLIGYIISMFLIDYKITFLSMIFIILSILFSEIMKKNVYKTNKKYKEALSINKEITLSKINNELYYRGLGISEEYFNKYKNNLNLLRKKSTKSLILQSSLEPLYSSIAMLGIFFIIYFGGKMVINNVYEIGTLSAFITTYILVARKAARVGKVFNAYQSLKVSWKRCKEYLININNDSNNQKTTGSVLKLNNFSFEYKNSFKLPIINIQMNKGEIIGVCGKVHTGKSTFLKALTGLYEYQGDAYLNDISINDIEKNENQIIGYCSSSVSLFSDSIKNNIELQRSGDLDKSLNVSMLKMDIDRLGGVDSIITHSNSNISGGQSKRLEMARSIYSCPSIILLDDPFQSVSQDMAIEMMSLLRKYNKSIIILVSNNKSILSKTDKIIYLTEKNALINNFNYLLNIKDFKDLIGE